jgi:hypothetical protein
VYRTPAGGGGIERLSAGGFISKGPLGVASDDARRNVRVFDHVLSPIEVTQLAHRIFNPGAVGGDTR